MGEKKMNCLINTALLLCISLCQRQCTVGSEADPVPGSPTEFMGKYYANLLSVIREKYSVWWANRLPPSGKTSPPGELRTLQSIPKPQAQPLC